MAKRKVCIVTGSRAEYGLLSVIMEEVRRSPELTLQVVATGMHLSPEFGLTYREIEHDGFALDAKVEMLLSSDTPVGISKSISLGISGFADTFVRLKPDVIVILGDRFEIFAAAQAALVAKIPVAHIAGGDITEGAFDEAIRHSITKMAHIHFVTNEASARRVRQLGEDPTQVHTVGSPGIDVIRRTKLMSREQLAADLGFRFLKQNLLVTFHPVTLDSVPSAVQFKELLTALEVYGQNMGVIFTLSNADTEGRVLGKMIEEYVASHTEAKAYPSLGRVRYLSCIAEVDAVVGNSSSGLYEVPSFKKPTVNIGDRQKGRLQASSVINCGPEVTAIKEAIDSALLMDCSGAVNPYGDGDSAQKIVAVLGAIREYDHLLKKRFFDL